MNTKLTSPNRARRAVRVAATTAGLLLASSLAALGSAATPVSPVGVWDCLVSGGGQSGLAFFTFADDFTFTGYELSAGKGGSSSSNDGRDSLQLGRGGDTNSVSANTNLFGFTRISGPWHYDSKGRVVGFFTILVNQSRDTTNYASTCQSSNIVYNVTNSNGTVSYIASTNFTFCFGTNSFQTNVNWSATSIEDGTVNNFSQQLVFVNTNATVVPGHGETNAISFVGKVVTGKRLTLVCATGLGKVAYKGVPYRTDLTDLSGNWQGTKRVGRNSYLEFFTLTSFAVENPFPTDFPDISDYPSLYLADGSGPGFDFIGVSMLSAHKRIGFVFQTSGNLSATVGSFSANRKGIRAKTKGVEEPLTKIKFDATFQGPFVVPTE